MEQRQDLLVERLKAGNREAATELVDKYYRRIYLFMRRLGCDRQISEDLTQESFFQAWQHIGQLRDADELTSWLYHIAGNSFRLYWRKHKRTEAGSFEGIGRAIGCEDDNGKIEHYEELGRLKSAVGRLPIKLKEAVILHYMEQLSISEATRAVGVSKGTFKSRLSRALKILKKQVM